MIQIIANNNFCDWLPAGLNAINENWTLNVNNSMWNSIYKYVAFTLNEITLRISLDDDAKSTDCDCFFFLLLSTIVPARNLTFT